jgi:signal peptidase I
VSTRSRKKTEPKSTASSIIELVAIVVVALLLALGIQAFLIKPYRIPLGSMIPTLEDGQRVLVNRLNDHLGGPHIGQIVVFHPPKGAGQEVCPSASGERVTPGGAACSEPAPEHSEENFIKRIVAGPGDVISIREGHVTRNGKREADSYIRACGTSTECNFPTPIKIPAGHWFMMGDNRGESLDSRFWGPVPTSWIIGDAFATYWPPGRIGLL